jgi:hypothetical protein
MFPNQNWAPGTHFSNAILLVVLWGLVAHAATKHHPANVPPTEEIEIISPNADPLDRPSAVLTDGPNGEKLVDIPPTVLVHKYYYTGDRSFQAQLLPGGPTIVVVNHPKTGERCYVEVQMMPGAPRVTYTVHGIEYDFGEHGIKLAFRPVTQKPFVRYRNGLKLHKKIGETVHAQQVWDHTKQFSTRATHTVGGATVQAGTVVKTTVVQPVQQIVGLMPFGKMIFESKLEEQFTQTYLQHKRQHAIEHAQKEAERQAATFRTNR